MRFLIFEIIEKIKSKFKEPEPEQECKACKELERKTKEYKNLIGKKHSKSTGGEDLKQISNKERECICENFGRKFTELVEIVDDKTSNGPV